MLLSLHVVNLALIREEDVEFSQGLNILTGETGAGKSILIGSLSLALGERLPKNMLREDGNDALIELVFSVEGKEQKDALERLGITPDEDTVIMTRRINSEGRSTCRINSETVTAKRLREAASVLITIHGQQEHGALLSATNHAKYLDNYAGSKLSAVLPKIREKYAEYGELKRLFDNVRGSDASAERELSFLAFEVNEIENAKLAIGEDEKLEEQFRKMNNAEKIALSLSECRSLTGDGGANASDMIDRALRALSSATELSAEAEGLYGELSQISDLVSDFNRGLSDAIAGTEFSSEEFEEVTRRLDLINDLKSKHGRTIEEILLSCESKKERIKVLEDLDGYKEELKKKLSAAESELYLLCAEATRIRQEAAKRLAGEAAEALKELNFPSVQFEIKVSDAGRFSAEGRDEIHFLISTNPGERLMPLEEVASGGELSRIMLALKSVLAESESIETLVFDEIDTGISGRTAQLVAEKMRRISDSSQVICITHLPQIAAMADSHFLIEKSVSGDAAQTSIRKLTYDESVEELARMLGGRSITDAVLENAREMKEFARRKGSR